MRPKSKHKILLHFIYTVQTQPEGNQIHYFLCACTVPGKHHARSGMAFSTCSVALALNKHQMLEHLGIRLEMLRLQDEAQNHSPYRKTLQCGLVSVQELP